MDATNNPFFTKQQYARPAHGTPLAVAGGGVAYAVDGTM